MTRICQYGCPYEFTNLNVEKRHIMYGINKNSRKILWRSETELELNSKNQSRICLE